MKKELSELFAFVKDTDRLLVITGAGCSTDSGIGDYRDDNGSWKKPPPVQYQDFLRSETVRKRYWLRSQLGYPSFRDALPNQAHLSLARLEGSGIIQGLITQNVDRLHQEAGQKKVIDLHGRLDQTICLGCNKITPRNQIQDWLETENSFVNELAFELRPDGDASAEHYDLGSFLVPKCRDCNEIIKPNVVFFGGSVPKQTVENCLDWVKRSDSVLIVGTSLMAYSAFRLVRLASERGLPIASLNRGTTRANRLVTTNIVENCSEMLSALEAILKA